MAAQQPQRGSSQVMLYSLAALLGAIGIGFLIAALFALGDDGPSLRSDVALPEPTATEVSGVAGIQSTQAPAETATVVVVPTQPAAQTSEPTGSATEPPASTPAATATAVPADTPVPVATSPPAPPPTAEPTEATTEEPTATPSGPSLTISGPATVAVGEPVQFSSAIEPAPVTVIWRYLGTQTLHVPFISVTFEAEGCYPIELVAVYEESNQAVVFQVSVGGASCS